MNVDSLVNGDASSSYFDCASNYCPVPPESVLVQSKKENICDFLVSGITRDCLENCNCAKEICIPIKYCNKYMQATNVVLIEEHA